MASKEKSYIHLSEIIPEELSGISREYRIIGKGQLGPGGLPVEYRTVIDNRGKLRLQYNDGTDVPLDQIPDILEGKNAEVQVFKNGVYIGQVRKIDLIEGDNVSLGIVTSGETVYITVSASTGSTFGYTAVTMVADNPTWLSMPDAETEFLGFTYHRMLFDLTGKIQTRIVVNVIDSAFSMFIPQLKLQYSHDQTNWYSLGEVNNTPYVNISSPGVQTSGWVSIRVDALADVYLRIVGENGNNSDPRFGLLSVQFK